MSARLATRNLGKRFGNFAAVSDVTVTFARGEIHAVLGENGAGKSTLMKLLFGLHLPSEGEVLFDGKATRLKSPMDAIRLGLGMVQQHFSLVETLSVIDNIMLGAEVLLGGRLGRGKAIERLEALLPSKSLILPWLTPVSELTVGQKQRLEILKLLFRQSDVLVLDEPTAVLAPVEIEELFAILRELKNQGRTIILITHKIKEVLALCDTYTVLRRGAKVGEGRVRDATASLIVEQMMGRKLAELKVDHPPMSRAGAPALKIRNLSELPRRRVLVERGALKQLDLEVCAGEIVGIAGVEGSGQSQLVDAIFGLREFSGELEVLGQKIPALQPSRIRNLGVGLIPEDRLAQGIWLDETCTTNLMVGLEDRFLKNEIFRFAELNQQTSAWAKEFDVRAASLSVPVRTLSGGNQQKIVFARELVGRAPKLLVCHQPTRGVDLGAIDLIHRRLITMRDAGLGILMISHELDELLVICDRIVVLFEGRAVAHFARADFDRFKIGAAMTGAQHVE